MKKVFIFLEPGLFHNLPGFKKEFDIKNVPMVLVSGTGFPLTCQLPSYYTAPPRGCGYELLVNYFLICSTEWSR